MGKKGQQQQQPVPAPRVDYTKAYQEMQRNYLETQAKFQKQTNQYNQALKDRTEAYQQQIEEREKARLEQYKQQAASIVSDRINSARSNAATRGIVYKDPAENEVREQIETEYQRLIALAKGQEDTTAEKMRMEKAERNAKGRGVTTVRDPLEDPEKLGTSPTLGG